MQVTLLRAGGSMHPGKEHASMCHALLPSSRPCLANGIHVLRQVASPQRAHVPKQLYQQR